VADVADKAGKRAKPVKAAKPAKPDQPRGLQRELVTPEGVDLQLRLAEASERASAFLLDAAIIVGILVVMTIVMALALAATKAHGATAIVVLWLFGSFVLRNLYFVLFELTPKAATPGKRILGLRVAARNGGRLTADAIFGRNAMRELEVFLPLSFLFANAKDVDAWLTVLGIIWCAVFVFFPLFNRDRLRVGDVVAGTWVVKTPKLKLLKDMANSRESDRAFTFTTAQLDAYGVKELQVLEEVLRRYDAKVVAAVAARIRAKIGWVPGEGEGDGDFLDAYYRALRGRLEGRLLFGRRRKDKHDQG
jgi:uncharacterized RDD family membrane protein YckC